MGLAVVSLVALTQMTSHVSQAGTSYQAASTTGMVTAARLKPGDRIAIASNVSWEVWVPQTFEISWSRPEFFAPSSQPPAGMTVIETRWTAGQPTTASWPDRPAGWLADCRLGSHRRLGALATNLKRVVRACGC